MALELGVPNMAKIADSSRLRWPSITCAAFLCLLVIAGCGALSPLVPLNPDGDDSSTLAESTIAADVTTAAPDTGLPRTLSGTLTGDLEGTYDEEILEVFFGDDGAPIAAVSRSAFTIEVPQEGTITTLNLVTVVETIIVDDGTGAPVPVGLRTAASGDVVHSTGAYEGVAGQLRTDSSLMFAGGEAELGTLDSAVVITLSQ